MTNKNTAEECEMGCRAFPVDFYCIQHWVIFDLRDQCWPFSGLFVTFYFPSHLRKWCVLSLCFSVAVRFFFPFQLRSLLMILYDLNSFMLVRIKSVLLFFLFFFFMATSSAYGSSWARDWIWATAVATPHRLTCCAGIRPTPPQWLELLQSYF